MNTQLNRTIKSISPKLLDFIKKEEAAFKSQADITIEKIDRSLLQTHGKIEEICNGSIICQSLYISQYLILFDAKLFPIPCEHKNDSLITQEGIATFDFLAREKNLFRLKAIVHLDVFEKFPYEVASELQWLKIRIATPKQNKPVAELVQEEIERRKSLAGEAQ